MVAAKRKFVCVAPPHAAPAPAEAAPIAADPSATAAPARRGAPQASDLKVLTEKKSSAPRSSYQPRSAAPCVVCIFKTTDAAEDLWNTAAPGTSLYQIQVEHRSRPSLTFSLFSSWNDFLKGAHEENEEIPATVAELQALGIKLILTGEEDDDSVGFVRWRATWYVAGNEASLQNFLNLHDSFLESRAKEMAREKPIEVQVHPHVGIELNTEGFEYKGYVWNAPSKALPLKFYEAHPPVGKKIITLSVEAHSESLLSFLFGGQLWSFRGRLDEAGVPSAVDEKAGVKVHCRLLKDIDCTNEGEKAKALGLFASVFKSAAMKLIIRAEPPADSPAAALVSELRELPCLHE